MIEEIHPAMPNLHYIPFDLEPFGMSQENDIFVATDQPHGLIQGTVKA